jgi:dihydroxy-acid dehydratase
MCGLGLVGTPGMGGPGQLIFSLDAVGLGSDVAMVTDGHCSGLVNMALLVVDVTPEAAVGGEIGLIKDDDIVEIDALNRKLNVLNVTEEEFAERRKNAVDFPETEEEGWLKLYSKNVHPIDEGAVLIR